MPKPQPIDTIPEYLVHKPKEQRSFLPPLMHYGWILDKDRALRFDRSHGMNPTVSDERGTTPNYYAACVEALLILTDEETGVIPDDSRIEIVYFSDGQYDPDPVDPDKYNFHLSLSVGTNYAGAISMKDINKLGEAVAPGVKPKWLLDMDKWTWSRRSVKLSKQPKPSSSNKSDIPRSASNTVSDTTVHVVAGKRKTTNKKPRSSLKSNHGDVDTCS